jgi:hypothetical protein
MSGSNAMSSCITIIPIGEPFHPHGAWLRRYQRLNTIVEPSKGHLIAFVEIAFISILTRRLKRLVVKEFSA